MHGSADLTESKPCRRGPAECKGFYVLGAEDEMVVENEREHHEDYHGVHLEVELQLYQVGQNDQINDLVLKFVGNFLLEGQSTMISPSMVETKKSQVNSL